MANLGSNEGVFFHKQKIYELLSKGHLTDEVVDCLLPNGEPIAYERQLWDYKLELPSLPVARKSTDVEQIDHNGKVCEIIKDVVAFYNSYGGYILAGVKDSPREVIGLKTGNFDCDELNAKVRAATGKSIECYFKTFQRKDSKGKNAILGLLFIPQRPDNEKPAQFIKDAVQKPSGKKPYSRNDIYFRSADQCIQAELTEHYTFLFTAGRRKMTASASILFSPVLDSNLGARDPAFIEFVGREEYLSNLWKWFLDKFNPVKLLAGIGGVGKTALAREFSEQVSRAAPFGFQKVVWLSAKRQFYVAISGKYVPSSRVDFDDVDGLLRQICLELGLNDEEVPIGSTREHLMEATIAVLSTMPALVVVDDIDTLDPEQQQDTFHALIAIFSQTSGKSPVGSRALLTARLDLGAAPGQVIRVKGMELDEFINFVFMTSEALDLSIKLEKKSKRMERFHRVTEGSPTFASSILRLVSLGEPFEQAMQKWEKSDGEEVRKFAFQKELDQLPDSATNVLYALCVLSDSTLVELSGILSRTEQQIRDDFAELRKYHLIAHAETHLPGGGRLSVPNNIRMMRTILKEKVRTYRRIETNCAKTRVGTTKGEEAIGSGIHRITALWGSDQAEEAMDIALMLDRQFSDNPDVKCLLGRAYLRLASPNFKKAELALRKSYEMGCARQELLPLWVETKAELGDWIGLLEITKYNEKTIPAAEILLARFGAYRQLAEIEWRSGNLGSAAEHYLEGGKEVDNILRLKKAPGYGIELKQFRNEFLTSYVELIDKVISDPNEFLEIWLAVSECFDCYVRDSSILVLGLTRLLGWWAAVEQRSNFSEKSAGVMDVQLTKLRRIIQMILRQESPDKHLLSVLEARTSELDGRLSVYRDHLGQDQE